MEGGDKHSRGTDGRVSSKEAAASRDSNKGREPGNRPEETVLGQKDRSAQALSRRWPVCSRTARRPLRLEQSGHDGWGWG